MISATTRLLLALFASLRVTLTRVTLVLVTLVLVTLTVGTWSLPASAQPPGVDEEAGRELANDAMVAYNKGDYGSALASFNKAREVYPTGQVLRMTGYTLFALENWVEAANTIDEALKTEFKPLSDDDGEHARSQLAEALTHIASVTITSSIDGAQVAVDDGEAEELPATVRIDPGSHAFVVSAPGHDDLYRQEELEAGQELSFTMDPKPLGEGDSPPPPKPEPKPEPDDEGDGSMGWFPGQGTVGLITAGVGVAVGAVGIVGLVYGSNLRSAVQENIDAHQANYDPACNTNTELCQYDIAMINDDGERAQTWQDTGLVMTITGGALLVAGVTLWVFAEDGPLADDGADDQASWSCLPGLTGMGASEGYAPSGVSMGCFGSF